jgi:transposase
MTLHPKNKNEREELAIQIGFDGHYLLHKIWFSNHQKVGLCQLESVEILRKIWIQQFTFTEKGLEWRNPDQTGLPPNSICIESPYDIDARNSSKRDINWTRYKVHFTETCDDKTPNFIINVETTVATNPDGEVTSLIHQKLAVKDLLPNEHYVDAAYVDAYQLVESNHAYQVSLVGPAAVDTSTAGRSSKVKSQKSKRIYNELSSSLEWSIYFRRPVLGGVIYKSFT